MLPTTEELGYTPSPFREGLEDLPEIPVPSWRPYVLLAIFVMVVAITLGLAL